MTRSRLIPSEKKPLWKRFLNGCVDLVRQALASATVVITILVLAEHVFGIARIRLVVDYLP